MKADLVDEPANDVRCLFPSIRLGEAFPKTTNLVDMVTGDVGMNADRVATDVAERWVTTKAVKKKYGVMLERQRHYDAGR